MTLTVPALISVGEIVTSAYLNTHRANWVEIDPDTQSAEAGQTLVVNEALDGFEFGAAGVALSWAAELTGDPAFPHTGKSTTDVTVSSAETWGLPGSGADREFPGRIVQLRRLDIDDEIRLIGGPWFVFIDTVDWGASGAVNNDGPDGTTGTGAASSQDEAWARGGRAVSTVAAEGGAGGGIQIWCVKSETGEANRPCSSNGGAGNRSGTGNASSNTSRAGVGAMSLTLTDPTTSKSVPEDWWPPVTGSTPELAGFLSGPSVSNTGAGGGTGGGTAGATAGGGSGIGGGARVASGTGTAGQLPASMLTPHAVVELALVGCRGGGGGAARISTTGENSGCGGGGGAVLRYVKDQQSAPTLSADGGGGVGPSGDFTGGAGYVETVLVP